MYCIGSHFVRRQDTRKNKCDWQNWSFEIKVCESFFCSIKHAVWCNVCLSLSQLKPVHQSGNQWLVSCEDRISSTKYKYCLISETNIVTLQLVVNPAISSHCCLFQQTVTFYMLFPLSINSLICILIPKQMFCFSYELE
jgi:hypothetical protein